MFPARPLLSVAWIFAVVASVPACIDVQADCGATGTGVTDDTAAFQRCVAAAVRRQGCVVVPGGTYSVTGVHLNVSNIHLFIRAGATLQPPPRNTRGIEGLLLIGSDVGAAPAHNVSILGVGGQFVLDCRQQAAIGQKIGAVRLTGNVRGFVVGNVRTKMAYGAVTPHGKDLNTNALAMGNVMADGRSYHPRDGHVFNITNSGSWGGYGLVQVQSAENVLFEHLDSKGGVTLRLETGVQAPGSFVGNITGRHITCRDGSSAFLASPHAQQNGDFYVYDLRSYGCFFGANLVPGYIQNNATVPGFFGNGSVVDGVQATFGATGAQCDDHCRANQFNGSSCAACHLAQNAAFPSPGRLGYDVLVRNVRGIGFPWQHNYSTCVNFNRHKVDCAWWPTPGQDDG